MFNTVCTEDQFSINFVYWLPDNCREKDCLNLGSLMKSETNSSNTKNNTGSKKSEMFQV